MTHRREKPLFLGLLHTDSSGVPYGSLVSDVTQREDFHDSLSNIRRTVYHDGLLVGDCGQKPFY